MAYRDFSLEKVKKEFQLIEKPMILFPNVQVLEPSAWLQQTLKIGLKLGRVSSSEKARSEFIVTPILLEMNMRNDESFAIFSGERLDVDAESGLRGECDFILSNGPIANTIQAPIFTLVEAKKQDIKDGLGQCVAQMLGAQIFNRTAGNELETIYGCVTSGEDWQFLRLQGQTIEIDTDLYYINEVGKLLWIFQSVIDLYQV
ncbi:MAG: hypothetical protein AAF639_46470 [Chloroflexota bacterium]